jgi:hypothetical protein
MKKILMWFKAAFEGYDGKASHQKLLVLYMSLLFTFVVVTVGVFNLYYPESIYHIIAGIILGQSGIRAWQTISNQKQSKDEEVK